MTWVYVPGEERGTLKCGGLRIEKQRGACARREAKFRCIEYIFHNLASGLLYQNP
jgi:hypothetical protein